ncbi:MAG: TonB-dependent receptor [Rhizomicrobium sp.]
MRLSQKAALCGSLAISALAWPAGAWAQQAPAAQNPDTIETVVVTASRRSESVQDVPGQVTAMTGSNLDQIHAKSFEDFAAYVPGLSFQNTGPTSDLIAIRGVTTGGSQLSGAVGMYVDQVPVGASSSFGLAFQTLSVNTFDLSRVEVLNGPQGTLYGSNALGGTIKYITAAPNLDSYSALAEAEGSNTDHGSFSDGLRLMANLPIDPGTAAIRIDGVQEFNSGYIDDPGRGAKNQGSSNSFNGRASLLWQVTPDLDVRLGVFAQNIDGLGVNADFRDFATGKPVAGEYEQGFALRQPSAAQITLYSGVADWNLQWATLTSVTGYQVNHGEYLSDVSDVYNPLLAGVFGVLPYGLFVDTNTSKFTQEVRLASPDNTTFEWLVGGYFTSESTLENIDLRNYASPDHLFFGSAAFLGTLPSVYQEFAIFGDGTYFVTDDFDIGLGIRYSNNEQHYQQLAHGILVVPADPAEVTHEDAKSNQDVVTYLVNPRWHINEDVMLYAKAASGYRPGGPNFVLALGGGAPTFQPDSLWNYEIGEKATLFDKRLTLNADIYDIEWSQIQLTVNNGGINQIENGGNARVQGAEVSFAYQVDHALSVAGSAAYTDAKLTTPAPALGLAHSGVRLPLSPRYNFALSANYTFDIAQDYVGDLNVTDRYIGDRTSGYAGSPISPLYKLPGYNSLDIDLAVVMPHGLELDAYIKNVFDEAGQVSASTLANEYDPTAPVPVTLSQPRTVGLVLKAAIGP